MELGDLTIEVARHEACIPRQFTDHRPTWSARRSDPVHFAGQDQWCRWPSGSRQGRFADANLNAVHGNRCSEGTPVRTEFLRGLLHRGGSGKKLVISDAHEGIKAGGHGGAVIDLPAALPGPYPA